MRSELARHPQRLQSRHPIVIEEMLALVSGGKSGLPVFGADDT